jgi:glycosyltransferase involved in cell wall biosynthesis
MAVNVAWIASGSGKIRNMMSRKPIYLSVILPAYNEAAAVADAIHQYVRCLSELKISFEIVVIDDGSTDDTRRQAEEAARYHPAVRVFSNSANRGQAASILRGFAESKGQIVMHNGIDLPFAPRETPRILDCLDNGADVVVVERYDRQAYGWFRKLVSWCNICLVKLLFHSSFLDHNFVQAYRRPVLQNIDVESSGVSTVTTELILKAVRLGFCVRSLQAEYQPRRIGQSTITAKRIVHTSKELLRLYRIMKRFSHAARPRAA